MDNILKQEKETFTVYPQLDPENKSFNKLFSRLVRAVLYDSWKRKQLLNEGKELTFKEAADLVVSFKRN